jgi:hypothetical protein
MPAAGGSSPAWRRQSGGGFVFPRVFGAARSCRGKGKSNVRVADWACGSAQSSRALGYSVPWLASGRIHGLWRTHASTALLYSLVGPDSAEGAQYGKSEGSRATCPRELFTEEGGVVVPQPSAVTGESLMSRRCRYIRRRHGPDGWRSVQKRPAERHSGCGCNAVPMPSCHREQGNPFTSSELPDGERGRDNYSGVGHPCHQRVSKVFRRGVVHCVLTCRRTPCRPGRFQSPGDQVSVQVAAV